MKKCIAKVKEEKECRLEDEFIAIKESHSVDAKFERTLNLLREKSAGAWLTCLPIYSPWDTPLTRRIFRMAYGTDMTGECLAPQVIAPAERKTPRITC